MNIELLLNNVRLAFSDALVEAKSIKGGKPRCSTCLILEDKESERKVMAAVHDIAAAEFNGKVPAGKDCAFRDGNDNVSSKTGEVYDGFQDKMYLSANRAESRGHPLIISNLKDPATGKPRKIIDPELSTTMDDATRKAYIANGKRDPLYPQAGDYANVKISLFSMNGKNDRGGNKEYGKKICCQIEVVQFKAKGTPFGASKPTADDFEALEEEDDADAMLGV